MSAQRSSRRQRVQPPTSHTGLIWAGVGVLAVLGALVTASVVWPTRRPTGPRRRRDDGASQAPRGAGTSEPAPRSPGRVGTPSVARGTKEAAGTARTRVSARWPATRDEVGPASRTERLSEVLDDLAGTPAEEEAQAAPEREAEAGAGQPLGLDEEAKATARAIREAVIAGVAGGRHETIHIEFDGGSHRGEVAGADEKGIQVSLRGVSLPIAWDKLDVRRLYFLGRKYLRSPTASAEEDARTRLALARYCLATDLLEEAQDELTEILRADPKMRDDEVLIATDASLSERRGAAGPEPEPERASIFSEKRELVTCLKCGGSGIMHWMACIQCKKSQKPGYLNMGDRFELCARCRGKGKLPGIRCDACGGKGKTDPDREFKIRGRRVPAGYVSCFQCGGTGVSDWLECVQCKRSDFPGYLYFGEYYQKCNRCGGRGKLPGIKCGGCRGKGIVREDR